MTEENFDFKSENSLTDLGRAATEALRAEPLDPQAMVRMRAAVAREWRAETRPVRRRRALLHWKWAAVASAAGLAALAVAWMMSAGMNPVVLGSITRSGTEGATARYAVLRHRSLNPGDKLRAGDTLTARSAALLSLAGGGTLRLASNSVIDVVSASEIRLQHGKIYVDKPPDPARSDPLRILTQTGAVDHLGTQFEVLSDNGTLRVRVREGRVRLRGAAGDKVADAGTEMLASPGRVVTERAFATYGPDWQWAAALAPNYDIEGRPLFDFLHWVGRELGLRVEFAEARAREAASRIILHGSVRNRDPPAALADVLATTTLRYEIRGDAIWVQLAP